MLNQIKNTLEKTLKDHLDDLNDIYPFKRISPLLAKNIKEFINRPGKRVRPILFIIGYLAFAKRTAPGLYQSALSIELLHDFMLIHDDIIDKSDTRRGKPSMHKMLDGYLKNHKNIKFNGQDLAIVAGDIIYAMALKSFLSIREDPIRKEKAMNKFLDAVLYTGSGQFIEIIYGIKEINRISKTDIYKIYDLKTAYYTFAYPLAIGATLAGAADNQVEKLFNYGLYLGRAFQIKDDILGMFGDEKKIGKSTLTDLQEAKKTLLIWYAYNNASAKDRFRIKSILAKNTVNKSDLVQMQNIISASGALNYAQREITKSIKTAQKINASLNMKIKYKSLLSNYTRNILSL